MGVRRCKKVDLKRIAKATGATFLTSLTNMDGVNVILCSGGIDDLCLKYFVEAGAMGVRRCKKVDLKRIAKATGATFLTSLTNMDGKSPFRSVLQRGNGNDDNFDDLCLKYFVEAGAMGVRRCKKVDLKRIPKATGATFLTSLTNMDGEEVFEASMIGEAAEVVQEQICDDQLILIKGPVARTAASIILRGPTDAYCDEMERSAHDALCAVRRVLESGKLVPGGGAVEAALSIYLENFATTLTVLFTVSYLHGPTDAYCDEIERSAHDALCAVRRVLESGKLVPGGGAVEAALSIYLENFATTLSSREQLAIAAFAQSLLVIPKTLAVNAARDATDLVAKLRAYHNSSQTKVEHANLKWVGLDLTEGTLRDNLAAGVLEPAISKVKSLKFATEAAITILRIDDMIKLDPEQRGGKSYEDACNAGEL
ncbi:TCP-1/cpn60 chaperonin family domain-containing protein [Phthorimaea operculella]|nr:TCP-1/cpn60 chaperonin family domain-containing protein [Phthorimaea operculella]